MIRIWRISGEELLTLPVEVVEDLGDVRALKQHLQCFCGLPRFQQKLLCKGSVLGDSARLQGPCDLQHVVLDFVTS